MSLPRNGRRSAMWPIDVMLRRQGRVCVNDNGSTDISFMGLRLTRMNIHLVVPSVSKWLVKMIIHLHKAESHNGIYLLNLRTKPRNTAELSHPEHAQKERVRQKKKYKGRTRKHEAHDAVYHNWFSPFLWSQIDGAVKHPSVGNNMSSWYLIKVLKLKDPVVFAQLSRSTIKNWIDQMGSKPQWSDATLRKAEQGNHQGHNHGGWQGALVNVKYYLHHI